MAQLHVLALSTILALTLGALMGPLPAFAAEPCCNVTAIDSKTQTVTAKETRTGRTFQFKVADARLLTSLKVGQAVSANFTTMKVSVQPDAQEPCCSIVNLRPAATAPVR
jgi:hypothetical protein